MQQQVGHEHASTTSIYTCVSSDFRTRTLRRALDQTVQAALATSRRREVRMRRQVSYQWRLRELMAERGMFATTELVPLLGRAGHRAVGLPGPPAGHRHPERLSLPVLAALCDILECTPAELIATRAANAAPRKTGTGDAVAAVELPTDLRPRRARLRPR